MLENLREINSFCIGMGQLRMHSTVWIYMYYKTRLRFLRKNQHFFRQTNLFTKEVIFLISRKIIKRDCVSWYFSTHCVEIKEFFCQSDSDLT